MSDYMPEEIQEIEDLQKINVAVEEPRQPLKTFYDWLESGDNDLFISEMNDISNSLWQVVFVRYEGINLVIPSVEA